MEEVHEREARQVGRRGLLHLQRGGVQGLRDARKAGR